MVRRGGGVPGARGEIATGSPAATPRVYPERWVYVSCNLNKDADVEEIRGIAQTAAEHGLNGMLLTGGFDVIDLQKPDYFHRLDAANGFARSIGTSRSSRPFLAGYGSAVLHRDPNLAEGLPAATRRSSRTAARRASSQTRPRASSTAGSRSSSATASRASASPT